MDAILEVYSEAGRVQVSGDGGIGFGLSATGNLTLVDDGATHPQPMVAAQVTVQGVNPQFAFKAPGRVCIERVQVSGSSFTYYLRAQSHTSIGLQWWVFDTSSAAIKDATMADIEVALYDQFGVKTFDATNSWMRIVSSSMHEIDGSIPYGPTVNLDQTTTFTVPSGRVYAIVQSSPSYAFTTYDTGGYSDSDQRPDTIVRGDETGEPGGNYNWRQQQLQSYQATGGYTGGNVIEVGLTKFEDFYLGWQPMTSDPFMQVYGRARHTIIDVTNFVSAGAIDPTTVVGNVNATTRSVSTGGAETIPESVTPPVTVSASGGTAPYSYQWQFVSGSDSVIQNGSMFEPTFSTRTLNQAANTTREAIYRCRITDANGYVGFSPDVTFTHLAATYADDYVPNALTLSPINFSTNAHHESAGDVTDLVGFNKPITLRVERYSFAGNIDGALVYVYRGPTAGQWGPWEHVGSFDPRGTGLSYVDFVAQPNSRLHYVIDQFTTSGRQDYAFDLVVWNLSNPGGPAVLSNRRVNITVDADNNHNVADRTLDPFTVPNLSLVTNEPSGWTNTGVFTVSGINATTTLRFTRGNQADSGNSNTRRLFIYHSTNNGASWTEYFIGAGPQGIADIGVNNGDLFHIRGFFDTTRGRADSSFTAYIANQSTGGNQIATFNVSGTTDADNNYYPADHTPDPINLHDLTIHTDADYGGTSHGPGVSVTGIDQPITIRLTPSGYSGNLSGHGIHLFKNDVHVGSTQWNGAAIDQSYIGGDRIAVYADAATSDGVRSGSATVTVTNVTTGVFLDSFAVNATVDADNNFNVTADLTPDTIQMSAMNAFRSGTYGEHSSPTYTLTGFTAPIAIRAHYGVSYHYAQADNPHSEVLEAGEGPISFSAYMRVWKNGVHVATTDPFYGFGDYSGTEQYVWADVTFSPGDTVRLDIVVESYPSDPGLAADVHVQGGVYFDTYPSGGFHRIGSFGHSTSVSKPYGYV